MASSSCGWNAEAYRERALRVEIDQQHPAALLGERGTEADGRRGLADAALLVADRHNPGGAVRQQRLGIWEHW